MDMSLADPISWDRLRVFHVAGKAGSFTRAGALLGLSQSAVSRQICALEEALKVALFYRHARGLLLTEQGEALYRAIQQVDSQISEALSEVTESRAQAGGALKINTTVAFGSAWLTTRIHRFRRQFPEVSVSLLLTDAPDVDLFSRQADVAIRFARQTHPRLVQLRLMSIRYRFFASREYVQQRGVPARLDELDAHELIVFGSDSPAPFENINWVLEAGLEPGRRRAATCINSVYGMYRAVKSGLGIAALPDYVIDDSPGLVEVLQQVEHPSFDAYFVYPEELRSSKRVAVIRDFLLEEAAREKDGQKRRAAA